MVCTWWSLNHRQQEAPFNKPFNCFTSALKENQPKTRANFKSGAQLLNLGCGFGQSNQSGQPRATSKCENLDQWFGLNLTSFFFLSLPHKGKCVWFNTPRYITIVCPIVFTVRTQKDSGSSDKHRWVVTFTWVTFLIYCTSRRQFYIITLLIR